MRNKQYRDAFVGSQIGIGLPFQIRALRERRGWKQSQLAEKTGMLQPRISAMEAPGGAKFTLETLRRLASAFDVALVVRFAPFSDLVRWAEEFSPDTFSVAGFGEDTGLLERKEPEKAVTPISTTTGGLVNRHGASHLTDVLKMTGIEQRAAVGLDQAYNVVPIGVGSGAHAMPIQIPVTGADISRRVNV